MSIAPNMSHPEIVMTISEGDRTSVYLASDENSEPLIYKTIRGNDKRKLYEALSLCECAYFPRIIKSWFENGNTFVIEEYIEGKTLEKVISEGLSFDDAMSVIRQLMEAVGTLHSMDPPLLHRDIKPENILVTPEGVLKLIDFEASREYKKEDKEQDTILLGTRGYAAPEQYGYNQTDKRSDVYSVGIVCNLIMNAVADGKRKTDRIRKVFTKATMFDPNERYEDIDKMYVDFLRRAKGGFGKWYIILPACFLCIAVLAVGMRAVLKRNGYLSKPGEITYFDVQVVPSDYRYVPIEKKVRSLLVSKDPYYWQSLDPMDGEIFHYLKAYPEALLFYDFRLESKKVKKVTFTRHSPNGKQTLDKFDLTDENDYETRNGIFCLNSSALGSLKNGNYSVQLNTDNDSFTCNIWVHGSDEEAFGYDAVFTTVRQYYSLSSKNSVLFYVYNTPYKVKEVFIKGEKVSETMYTLTFDGRGIAIWSDALSGYSEGETVDFSVTMGNARTAYGQIIIIQ